MRGRVAVLAVVVPPLRIVGGVTVGRVSSAPSPAARPAVRVAARRRARDAPLSPARRRVLPSPVPLRGRPAPAGRTPPVLRGRVAMAVPRRRAVVVVPPVRRGVSRRRRGWPAVVVPVGSSRRTPSLRLRVRRRAVARRRPVLLLRPTRRRVVVLSRVLHFVFDSV